MSRLHPFALVAAGLALAAGLLVLPAVSWAFDVKITPAEASAEVVPGTTWSLPVMVTNMGRSPIHIAPEVGDLWYTPDKGMVSGPPGTYPRTAAPWIDVSPPDKLLAPTESAVFVVRASPPADIEGGYYAMVVVQAKSTQPVGGSRIRPQGRIGIQIRLAGAGTGTRGLEVLDTRVTPPTEATPLTATLEVRSTGDTHIRPTFRGVIRTEAGRSIGRVESGRGGWLFPGQAGSISLETTTTLTPGRYVLVGAVVFAEQSVAVSQVFDVPEPVDHGDAAPATPP